ncbi:DTW domain-containing protein [Halioxenophilus sp. WMMB6]|uniref:DTW domain-containing protein n=1 Tax=Halioxenophilus sp. WMMB6 TaxID=3073815 RepID=UPI00295E84AE|nr:DTW domain-containing protein [Halioxenophilus sp. WMMB6]
MTPEQLLNHWLALPNRAFAREPVVTGEAIACDCSGLINLLFEQLQLSKPYQLARPKAVHYFAILQEIGSNRLANLKPGNLLAWRKDKLPKSGDSGHVLMVAGEPLAVADHCYRLAVVDATKLEQGIARREIELQVDEAGQLIGVRLHRAENKFKRTAIYHHPLSASRYCFGCALPKRVCNCGAIDPILPPPPITILRHPEERGRTLSTVSLIKQRYPAVLVKEGEHFAPLRQSKLALLFPDATNIGSEADDQTGALQVYEHLILIDATWRKAKRILHQNPWLQALPKVALRPEKSSDYLLRKVADAGALSSVEAFALAVADGQLAGMLKPFMERQIALMGESVYQKNYRHYLNFSGLNISDHH